MGNPNRLFDTWRSVSLTKGRDVIDGILKMEHRGRDPALRRFLAEWPGAWYWGDDARTRLVLVRGDTQRRPERWLWHGALLVLFLICTLGAGAVVEGRLRPPAHPGLGGAVTGALEFANFVVHGGGPTLLAGGAFAVPLLAILLIHELGHYFAARRYSIDVSPPYFIPVPPNLSPIGGLGAFIRIRSRVYDRQQLLSVGALGPLAGFIVAIGVLLWGYQVSHRVLMNAAAGAPSVILFAGHPILLGDSLITRALRDWLVPGGGAVLLAPQAFAGWVGMFITGLNLLPLSQLDGGHVLYGLLGDRQRPVAIAVGIGLLVLSVRAPMWILWAILTFAIGGGRWGHPEVVIPGRHVTRGGWVVGALCIVVLILTFVPVPFPGG